jgi:hypothetical protein
MNTIAVGISDGSFANPGTNSLRFDSNCHDIIITDTAFCSPAGAASSALGKGALAYSHVYFRNMIHEGANSLTRSGGYDAWCAFEQCVLGQIGTDTPSCIAFKDSYVAYGFQGPAALSVFGCSGDTAFNATTGSDFHLNTLVQDPTVGDLRPLTLMPSKTRLDVFDALYNTRTSTDKIGVLAGGAARPIYPF